MIGWSVFEVFIWAGSPVSYLIRPVSYFLSSGGLLFFIRWDSFLAGASGRGWAGVLGIILFCWLGFEKGFVFSLVFVANCSNNR